MAGETDLRRLLATMRPEVRDGEFVFVSLDADPGVPCEATVREDEGLTCIVRREVADEMGWPYDFVAGWITLQVHSALEGVGLTAAVSAALAAQAIPSNVVAGFFHDHMLVPQDRLADAMLALTALGSTATGETSAPRSPDQVRRSAGRRATDRPAPEA